MVLLFVLNIVLLLCISRHTLAQATVNLTISFVTPSAHVVGFSPQGTVIQTNELNAFVELPLPGAHYHAFDASLS